MLVFDPATLTVTRFTLAKGYLMAGYEEMIREELVQQVTRDIGSLSAEQVRLIQSLPVAVLEELEAALWDIETMADSDAFLARVTTS